MAQMSAMPWMKWLPWRFLIRRVARAHGFLDPVLLLSHLHRFAQPSEVSVPLELLRAGVVFHARGLINSRVIQHNLDWVWPYWIERQFDPHDVSFVPRAFSITHVNLTHRNWTAVGVPDLPELALVDPRGLLTPFPDGWSLDCWVIDDSENVLLPSRAKQADQWLGGDRLTVVTECSAAGMQLRTEASMQARAEQPVCRWHVRAEAENPAWLVLALRPCNPEGVSFIHRVALSAGRDGWKIDDRQSVSFGAVVDRHHVSNYHAGDVYIHLREKTEQNAGECDVGMATAAAMFRIEPGAARELTVDIVVADPKEERAQPVPWEESLQGHCQMRIPDERYMALYETALRTLIVHSPLDVFPGPYTYKRFWFRDAAFIIHALICAGLISRAERALDRFPARQDFSGYFNSQEGEWDSNGEALWVMQRFCALTGRAPKPQWRQSIVRGTEWITRKRLPEKSGLPHAGLLPAGFSAEHLGPNDYYYWDDFWSVAGLEAAHDLIHPFDGALAQNALSNASALRAAIDRSLGGARARLGRPAMPASPYRRMDSGAVGSLAAGYPLQLCSPDDPRLIDTVAFLLDSCFFNGGFFQDMIHSGINPYLTLHVAQVLLRAGDPRHLLLTRRIAELASPTGQWPEAIHPHTLGGCMGDGQHVWAAAEWILMLRNGFVREEGSKLVIGAGLDPAWLNAGAVLSFGPAPTEFGTITISIDVDTDRRAHVRWQGDWHQASALTFAPVSPISTPILVEVRLPGAAPNICTVETGEVIVVLGAKP
ncbi:MAG: hypothetical protein LBV36_06970 [Chromatiales bacterium]|jgi:hypothetical protein|nr:hypothetical protein [Chromatiales bacterium]